MICRRFFAMVLSRSLPTSFALAAAGLLASSPAEAARFHVQVGGTRTSGPSEPGNWTSANCYPDLASASAAASATDSVLIFDEDHDLSASVQVPAFLGNPRLDGDHSTCRIVYGSAGQLVVDPASVAFEARGITFTESATTSDHAAFLLDDPAAGLSSVLFVDCFFLANRGSGAVFPGGSCVTALAVPGPASLRFVRCELDSNSTEGPGGALYVEGGYDLQITESVFRDNTSLPDAGGGVGKGGAIAIESGSNPTSVRMTDCFLSGNQAWGPGGACWLLDCDIALLRTEISDSRSATGGLTAFAAGAGIHAEQTRTHAQPSTFSADACIFRANTQDLSAGRLAGDGGGILVKGVSGQVVGVSIFECIFEGNYAAQGAGVYVGRYAEGTVRRCRFLENTSHEQGGATYKGGAFPDTEGETAVYEYCDFIGNETGLTEQGVDSPTMGRGGAFATRTYPRAEFYNCTFVDNVANGPLHRGDALFQGDEDGPLDSDTRRCELHNCVFYGTGGNDVQVYSRADGFSIVENCAWETGEFSCANVVPLRTVVLTGSPFESLTDPLPFFGSPLIDAALDVGLTKDLVGNPVPNGPAPDVGAYEGLSAVGAAAVASAGSLPLASRPNPFRATVTISYHVPAPGFVDIEIIDITGRRIARLDRGVRAAGRHEMRWAARDDAGNDVASGVYFVRLRTSSTMTVGKVVLAR